ncbi:aminotransferase class I/II-fold pyridoxal phosphate-dependent enzyme [candidate division KSB1 bacterium]|nr:aminotransferase class I/II-fold pyridoxal phosphate-dependent enzyme [candidate division KSB1 bacterium]
MVDLRSDTVTKPSKDMLAAMMNAEVGDDIYGEDPTANRLQEKVAALLGKEAALFVASGTMANQICLNVLTDPGDEVICESDAHIFHFESGALAKLSGIQVHRIPGHRGMIDLATIKTAIRPSAHYFPRTKVIALENTHNLGGGTILPLDGIEEISKFAHANSLFMHLDGARLWNASAATGIELHEYARHFDSVSMCFSKGMGAPVGSIIAGSEAFIREALRCRKQFGGAMRQIGYLAAACIYAIDHNFARLPEDHQNAKQFAEIVAEIPGIDLDVNSVLTNIVVFTMPEGYDAGTLTAQMKEAGFLVLPVGPRTMRIVTHLDVARESVIAAAHKIVNLLSA